MQAAPIRPEFWRCGYWARLKPNCSELPKETAMILYAALDVAIEKTALCIVDREGAVVLETNVASDPDALADCLAPYHLKLARLGLEAGPLSEWLVRGFGGPRFSGRPLGNRPRAA